jgi:hypothetical protein
MAIKKGMTKNFFSPLSFVAVFGSEIRDRGWLKIRIRDKHPGSATLPAVEIKNVLFQSDYLFDFLFIHIVTYILLFCLRRFPFNFASILLKFGPYVLVCVDLCRVLFCAILAAF